MMREYVRDAAGRFARSGRTLAALGKAVEEDMPAKTDLVYVAYDDKLMDTQIAAIVRGDQEEADESLWEWSGESSYMSATEMVDELAKEVVGRWTREDGGDYDDLLDEWQASDERMSAIDMAQSRDESDPMKQLARNSGDVLLRLPIDTLDEDADLDDTTTAEELLDALGFVHTDVNLAAAQEILSEGAYPGAVLIGYALIAVDVEDVYNLPGEGEVEIRNPHVYLGNPFAGSGWAAGPFEGTMRYDRKDLRTDRDAFGYSWTEIAGPVVSAYRGEVAAVTE